MVKLSIVIVNWNTCDHLQSCLQSLAGDDMNCCEVIVVDNASSDDSVAMVREKFPWMRLVENAANAGFAGGCNQGIRASGGEYILLLNSDTLPKLDALRSLVDFMDEHTDAGGCGPRLLCPDGSAQAYTFGQDPTLYYLLRRGLSQSLFRHYLHDWTTDQIQNVDWVSGACLIIRRTVIDQAGLLDENMFMYFEDNDLCLRIRQAGWQIYYNPQVEIVHLGGQSLIKNPRAQEAYYESLKYFYVKHYSLASRILLKLLLIPYQLMTGQRGIRHVRRTS